MQSSTMFGTRDLSLRFSTLLPRFHDISTLFAGGGAPRTRETFLKIQRQLWAEQPEELVASRSVHRVGGSGDIWNRGIRSIHHIRTLQNKIRQRPCHCRCLARDRDRKPAWIVNRNSRAN